MDAQDDDINVDAIEVVKGPVALINSTGMDVVCVIENSSTDRKVRGNSPPKINNIYFSVVVKTKSIQTLPFIAASSSVIITLIKKIWEVN